MPETRTPGQVAYEAFWACPRNDGHWAMLDAVTQQRWEAAAEAVRAACPVCAQPKEDEGG